MKKLAQKITNLPLRLLVLSLSTVMTFSACANNSSTPSDSDESQTAEGIVLANYANDSMTRTGQISSEELIKRYQKFEKSFNSYRDLDGEAEHLNKLKGMEIVAFFGLWCHDSQREIPRLLKLNKLAGSPFASIKLVAVSTEKELPPEYQSKFELNFTPTIYVLQDGQILAKIVEKPKVSLVKDLLSQILH
ncbi:MAG: thioredoxin family protein [Kangiellaceae bacterium]|nr:thioredoxin family protein [Kangiellaceae bacterium]MCW9016665.1 thioredoxin family protein [Kangiellaceae bacterium]